MAKKNNNKTIIIRTNVTSIACKDELHKALQPIEIGAEKSGLFEICSHFYRA